MSHYRDGLPFGTKLFVIWVVCAVTFVVVAIIATIDSLYIIYGILWPFHFLGKAMGFKGIFAPDAEIEANTITINKAGPR